MDSFPPSFNSENIKYIPDLYDDLKPILCHIRTDIVQAVEKQRQLHEKGVYFYISYNNTVVVVKSISENRSVMRGDYNAHYKYCYGSQYTPTPMEMKHRYILKTIGDELKQLFGNNFETVHETGWDSEDYALYPISDDYECSGMCHIHFIS